MIVEDGTGLSDANAYITEAFFEAYCEAHGYVVSSGGDVETDIVRATTWIDGEFGGNLSGTKLNGRSQSRLWPRENATDREGEAVDSDSVPIEWQNATAEAAYREHENPSSLAPDQVASSQVVEREKLGPLEVEYGVAEAGAASTPWYPIISGILAPLIGDTSPNAAAWYWR